MPLPQYNLLTRHRFCTNLPSDRPRPVSFFATAVALRRCRYRPHRHWCSAVAASAISFFSIVPLVVFSASRYAALLSFCAAAPIPCISDSICSITVLLFVSVVRKNRLDCASLAFVHLYHHRIGHLQPIHLYTLSLAGHPIFPGAMTSIAPNQGSAAGYVASSSVIARIGRSLLVARDKLIMLLTVGLLLEPLKLVLKSLDTWQ